MRKNICEIKKDRYTFCMELDTGGEERVNYTCWIYLNGEPLCKPDSNFQVRKDFGTSFNKHYFKNFVCKFLNNEEYRNSIINA